MYAVVHEELTDSIRVCFLLFVESADAEFSCKELVEEASKPLHGTPPILSIQVVPHLLTSLDLPSDQHLPALVCFKDHVLRSFNTIALSSASKEAEISDWLIQHSLPLSTELNADNFATIMGSPSASPPEIRRLAVIAAINNQDLANIEELRRIAKVWLQENKSLDGKVVFTWMDRERWASWLKSAYGIKAGSEAVVVLVDHNVSQVCECIDNPVLNEILATFVL